MLELQGRYHTWLHGSFLSIVAKRTTFDITVIATFICSFSLKPIPTSLYSEICFGYPSMSTWSNLLPLLLLIFVETDYSVLYLVNCPVLFCFVTRSHCIVQTSLEFTMYSLEHAVILMP